MSWFSKFFNSSVAKKLLDLSGKLLVARLGEEGKRLWNVAKEEAYKAEQTGQEGAVKRQMVLKALQHEFVEAKQGFLDTAIQLAWMWVDTVVMEAKGKTA